MTALPARQSSEHGEAAISFSIFQLMGAGEEGSAPMTPSRSPRGDILWWDSTQRKRRRREDTEKARR
jgi:hypothetical protein